MRFLRNSIFLSLAFSVFFISAGAVTAQADCLAGVKAKLLMLPPVMPPEVLSQMKINATDYACMAKKEISFDKTSSDPKYTKVNSVSYSYDMQARNGKKLESSYGFSAKNANSSAASFELFIEYSVTERDGRDLFTLEQNYIYDNNCRAILSNTEKTYYQQLPTGEVKVTTIAFSAGGSETRDTVIWSREVAEANNLLNKFESPKDAIVLTDGRMRKIVGDDGDDNYYIFEPLAPIKGFNSIKGRDETMHGIRLNMLDSQKQPFVSVDFRFTQDESFSFSTSTAFDGSKNFSQKISESEWFLAGLNVSSSDEQSPTLTGFTEADWSRRTLGMTIETKTPFRHYENAAVYFDAKLVSATNPLQWSIVSLDRNYPQKISSWNAANSVSDQPYLAATKFIHPQAVAPIVDKLRPQLVGKNRLEAALIILESISKILVKYDQKALELGLISIQSTEDILRNRTGVCQHYAALFVAMARQLGIPARVVSGYSLHAKSANAHAWVELKINDHVWWPLEPQIIDVRLPSRSYFPIDVMMAYEVPAGNPKLESQIYMQTSRRWSALRQVKITRANSVIF